MLELPILLEGNLFFYLIKIRLIYSIFYKKTGGAWNKGRILGVVISMIAILANSGIFFKNIYKSYVK